MQLVAHTHSRSRQKPRRCPHQLCQRRQSVQLHRDPCRVTPTRLRSLHRLSGHQLPLHLPAEHRRTFRSSA